MQRTNIKTVWTEEEIRVLIEKYQFQSNNDIALLLNKSRKSVIKKLKELNLYRTKEQTDLIRAKVVKRNNRDLTFELVSEIAKQFNTRHEFYLKDAGAYSAAIKHKWINKVCEHMVVKNVSMPQLILKAILEDIFKTPCSFNDRKVIYPLEIDCFFSQYNIGWEYDGKYYHSDVKDKNKRYICSKNGITLFNIKETTPEFRNYELNIKNQLIKQLKKINEITNNNLSVDDVLSAKVVIDWPNLLTEQERVFVKNKSLSEIKKMNPTLFKRIKKYSLCEQFQIVNDLKVYNKFKSFDEYLKYLIKKNYHNFTEMCNYEHPYRLVKQFKRDISEVKQLYE